MPILKPFAIIIYSYYVFVSEYYRIVFSITDKFYINDLINFFGKWILILPIYILIRNLYNSEYWKILSLTLSVISIMSLIGISIADLMAEEVTNLIIAKVYHPMTLEFKKEFYMVAYNKLMLLNELPPITTIPKETIDALKATRNLQEVLDLSYNSGLAYYMNNMPGMPEVIKYSLTATMLYLVAVSFIRAYIESIIFTF